MHELVSELFPIYRSLTGDGVRKTLSILQSHLPAMAIHEVPSGTKCFDWTVPREWRVKRAYIVDPAGRKFCDIATNNLHLVVYSTPVNATMTLDELLPHLHSLPQQPDAIPYATSYYSECWGFCISEIEKRKLAPGKYQVLIESELFDGSLTYGELLLPGTSSEEVLISTYVCHPSMANDELSGPVVACFAAKWIQEKPRRLSYRFVFVPETIGAIAFLSDRHKELKRNVIAGFNLSCIGDDRNYSMVESRKGNTLADKVAAHVLQHIAPDFKRYTFLSRGSDERQYCSPGIDLPLCTLSRTKFGEYPEYHTHFDNLSLVTPSGLEGGLNLVTKCLQCLELDRKTRMTVKCEPQLGRRGLYSNLSMRNNGDTVRDLTNLIAYSDGSQSLVEIADRIGRPMWSLLEMTEQLVEYGLMEIEK